MSFFLLFVFVFLNFSFTVTFLLVDIFLLKQFILLHLLRDSSAGVARESAWPAGKVSAKIVVGGGMRCCGFFLLVADISLKVFAGLILSGECICGMACGLFVETDYSIYFFYFPSSAALYACEVVFMKFLVFLHAPEDFNLLWHFLPIPLGGYYSVSFPYSPWASFSTRAAVRFRDCSAFTPFHIKKDIQLMRFCLFYSPFCSTSQEASQTSSFDLLLLLNSVLRYIRIASAESR